MTTVNEQRLSIPALVLGICEKIHGQYGPGLLKSIYEDILCYELAKRDVAFVRQYLIDLVHDGVLMNTSFMADIVIEDTLLVEVRSSAKLEESDIRSVKTYVKLAGLKQGLLINFNEVILKNGIRKVAGGLGI